VAAGSKPVRARTLAARAVGYLARRDYARAELRAKLLAAGAAHDEVDTVLDELAARGYLSDERYAQALVREKHGAYSRRALAETLKGKGVAADVVAATLNDVAQDDTAVLVSAKARLRPFGDPQAAAQSARRRLAVRRSAGVSRGAASRRSGRPDAIRE
jgi:regulatory protein